jgi:hypothetical protein
VTCRSCRAGPYEACDRPVPTVAEWLYREVRPLEALRGSVTQSRYALHAERKVGGYSEGGARRDMRVLIGVDPHKATNALAVIDEHGELLERAEFSADRQGLRALERWARRFPERRWAVEGANALGRTLAHKLASTDEEVVDVPPKLSARVRVLSVGNGRKNDELDATFAALAAWRNERAPGSGAPG